MTLRQASEKARDPEVVARLIDPDAWAYADTSAGTPTPFKGQVYPPANQWARTQPSLTKARAIIALSPDTLPLIEALEGAERALAPFADLAGKFAGPVVEISMPHPDNPSGTIVPVQTMLFQRLSAALTQIRRTLNHAEVKS